VTIAKRPSEEAGRRIYITDLGQAASEISEIPKQIGGAAFDPDRTWQDHPPIAVPGAMDFALAAAPTPPLPC
jgi:hypothetical protein